jgi:hypothetical protein
MPVTVEAWSQRRRTPLPSAVLRRVGRFVFAVVQVTLQLRPPSADVAALVAAAADSDTAAAAAPTYVRDLHLSVSCDGAALLDCEAWTLPSFPGPALAGVPVTVDAAAGTVTVPVHVRVAAGAIPASLSVTVSAQYSSATTHADLAAQPGQPAAAVLTWEPRTAVAAATLPLDLFVAAVPPAKDAACHVTVDINRTAPPPLTELFPELLGPALAAQPELARSAAGVMTLAFASAPAAASAGAAAAAAAASCGAVATVIASKKGGRLRVQASRPAALAALTAELVERLQLHARTPAAPAAAAGTGAGAGAGTEGPLVVSCREELPLDMLEAAAAAHWGARARLVSAHSALAVRTAQYRGLQRRLLALMKDKSPAPAAALQQLLRQMFEAVSTAAIEVEALQTELTARAADLRAVLALTVLLARLTFGLDAKNSELLRLYLPTVVDDGPMPSAEFDAAALAAAGVATADDDAGGAVASGGDSGDGTLAIGFEPQGWHEAALASVTFILHASLRKQVSGAAAAAVAAEMDGGAALAAVGESGLSLKPVKDPAAVMKLVRELFDLLAKGARFHVPKPAAASAPSKPTAAGARA